MFNFDFKRFVWQIGDYTSSPSDLKTLKLGLGFGLGLELRFGIGIKIWIRIWIGIMIRIWIEELDWDYWKFPCSSLLSLKLRSPVNQRRWRVAPDHSNVQHYHNNNYWFMFSLSSSDAYHVFSAPFCRIEKRSWWPQLIPLQLWKLLKLHREQKLIGLHASFQLRETLRADKRW